MGVASHAKYLIIIYIFYYFLARIKCL